MLKERVVLLIILESLRLVKVNIKESMNMVLELNRMIHVTNKVHD